MKTNGSTAGKQKRSRPFTTVVSNATIMRFLLVAIAFSTMSVPLVLHFSLTGTCVTTTNDPYHPTSRRFSTGNAPPRIRGLISGAFQPGQLDANTLVRYTLDNPPEHSPYSIIHSVLTRFMVGQSSKYTLARARYLLFETFCWPTMQHQTNQNFYWLVLVDPGLHKRILEDMKSLLQTMPNAFMILTNNTAWAADGIGVENATSYGVGLRTVAEEFQRGAVDVVTGNTTYLLQVLDIMEGKRQQSALNHTKPIMAIETLLDADDGLNNYGVDWIQSIALTRAKEQHDYLSSPRSMFDFSPKSPIVTNLDSTWWFLCGTDHIEWHNRDIFRVTREEYAVTGLTAGLAGVRSNPYFCTSAGFTRIGLTQPPSSMKFPKDAYSNHALAFYFAPCTSADNFSILPAQNVSVSRCWRREFAGRPFILKSRTIVSDSMDNMNPRVQDYRDVSWLNNSEHPLIINETEAVWENLVQDFSVSRHAAWTTSVFLYENRKKILRDNRAARCSPGFPCYKTAKKNLVLMERYLGRQEVKKAEQTSGTPRKFVLRGLGGRNAQRQRSASEYRSNVTSMNDPNDLVTIRALQRNATSLDELNDVEAAEKDQGR